MPHNINNDELGAVDAAAYIGRAPSTLATWRVFRTGPKYRKAGEERNSQVFYRRVDLDAWLAEHRPVV
ncbi:helix-turn-helix transcriptional regulator [Rhodococcus opacus]|uniref:helix-turn-helix transcriptional regulator n=1 Tax=Rhodococcus opacus TaxID=37919 RepID=UPI001C471824|nr:hypothetical protein [Rhodococcus opacus]MBV6763056.1 hypothetical protein [Rhodococcus opacus]